MGSPGLANARPPGTFRAPRFPVRTTPKPPSSSSPRVAGSGMAREV